MEKGRKPDSTGGIVMLVLCGVVLAGLLLYGASKSSSTSDTASNSDTTPSESSAPDPADILKNADFQRANPHYNDAIRQLIIAQGYECPALSELWLRGESPLGEQLEALCGPNNGRGDSYTKLHYAVYPSRLTVRVCEEYAMFSAECK